MLRSIGIFWLCLLLYIFVQEMLEVFTDVTELLRHFYAITSRMSSTSGTSTGGAAGSAAARAEAILARLVDVHSKGLEAKKRSASEQTYASVHVKEACISLINGVLILIQRAKVYWDILSNDG
jgi:hypothetical protein